MSGSGSTSAGAPTVSVIVPMYQSGWSVPDTLESLRLQTLADFEAIIVNDGSTDDGPALARGMAGRDARFRVIDRANGGLAAARNTGLAAARGEFVHFLDADDLLTPRGLETLVGHARRTGAAAVLGRLEHREASGRPTGWAPMLERREIGLDDLRRGCAFAVHAQLIRRDALGDTRFDPARRIGEDWDLWLRLARRGVRWQGVDTVVGGYRMTPGSLSRASVEMWRAMRSTVTADGEKDRETPHQEGPPDPGSCDPSHQQRRVLGEVAMEWATSAAFAPDHESEGLRVAVQVLREEGSCWGGSGWGGSGWVDPARAAVKVFHRGAWQRGFAPNRWARAGGDGDVDAALRTAGGLWRCFEDAGLAEPGLVETAARTLADLAATPDRVASALADEACASVGGGATLLGLGRNARYVAEALARRGVRMWGVDDGVPVGDQPQWARDLGVRIEVVPFESAGATRVLTVGDESAVPASWRGPWGRWSAAHRRVADGITPRLLGIVRQAGRTPAERRSGA